MLLLLLPPPPLLPLLLRVGGARLAWPYFALLAAVNDELFLVLPHACLCLGCSLLPMG